MIDLVMVGCPSFGSVAFEGRVAMIRHYLAVG